MTSREKLIELIQNAKKNTKGANCDLERDMLFADYLLENGVMVSTVNNWISVKDKLPNSYELVLVYMPDKKLLPKICEGFISEDGIWCAGYCVHDPGEVVAWQEMPEPPSSETWLKEE